MTCCVARGAPTRQASYAGLTRVSIDLHKLAPANHDSTSGNRHPDAAAEARLDQAGALSVRGALGRADRDAAVVAFDLQRVRQGRPAYPAEFRHAVLRS